MGLVDVAAADVVIFTAPQAFTLGHGLCLVRAAPLLLVLGRLQGLVLLEGLASEGLPDPGVWGGSRPKPSPRSRPRPGHLHVASTSCTRTMFVRVSGEVSRAMASSASTSSESV